MAPACSDDPQSPAGTGGSAGAGGGAGTGGSAGGDMTAGTGGTETGGTETGGTGGDMMANAGAGGETMDRTPDMIIPDAMCSGISNGNACALIGTCAGRGCGIADSGSRDCVCGTDNLWDCTSCAFPMDFEAFPFLEPPSGDAGAVPACDDTVAEDNACTERGVGCSLLDEYCVCWDEEVGAEAWDCDDFPSFWPE